MIMRVMPPMSGANFLCNRGKDNGKELLNYNKFETFMQGRETVLAL